MESNSVKRLAKTKKTKEKYYTPPVLKNSTNLEGFVNLSGGFFKSANELLNLVKKDNKEHFYPILSSIILFATSLESYFNETLNFSLRILKNESDRKYIEDLKLGLDTNRKLSLNQKIKKIFLAYDKDGKGIDPKGDIYQDLVALINLRNEIVHYNPKWISLNRYPRRVQLVLNRSKIKLVNSDWTTNCSNVKVGQWAHDTVKNTLIKFSDISGTISPFNNDDKLISFNWE